MTWTKEKIAKTLDHAALKPNMTDQDITDACALGRKYRVASVCVRPSDVLLAARELAGSGVDVAAVIGFPHGAHRPETKALEAKLAIADGANELDMVMNVGKFLSGDHEWVGRDIAGVVAEAQGKRVLVKVILESTYLTLEQVAKACEIARDAGANFVKTSTGFADVGPGATPEAIAVMVQTVGATLGVKASGGVRDYLGAVAFLEQGCTRLGTAGGTKAICENAPIDPPNS